MGAQVDRHASKRVPLGLLGGGPRCLLGSVAAQSRLHVPQAPAQSSQLGQMAFDPLLEQLDVLKPLLLLLLLLKGCCWPSRRSLGAGGPLAAEEGFEE